MTARWHAVQQLLRGDRLDQVGVELPDGLDGGVEGRVAGQQKDGELRVVCLDLFGELDPAAVGQLVVDDDDGRLLRHDELERVVHPPGRDGLDPLESQHPDEGLSELLVVVDQEDDFAGSDAPKGATSRRV